MKTKINEFNEELFGRKERNYLQSIYENNDVINGLINFERFCKIS